MRKYISILFLLFSACLFSQNDPVLLKINGKEITRSQFEYSYRNDILSHNGLTPAEYLELFIDDQLKIAEAKELGLDDNTNMEPEIDNLRRQLIWEYFIGGDTKKKEILSGERNTMIEGYHIYKYLPQNTPTSQVNRINNQMDSLYNAIIRNLSIDFMEIVEKYSDDQKLFSITRLDVPEEFEKEVFSLQPGEISKPFFTPQGIHIVKVVRKFEPITQEEVTNINRGEQRRKISIKAPLVTANKIKQKYEYNLNQSAVNELITTGKTQSILFSINGKPYTMAEFERFALDNPRGIKLQVDEFITKSLYDYENSQLESNHSELETKVQWNKDRLLLKEINNRITGDDIINNKSALKDYFDDNKKDYYWELPRYRGIVVHCKSKRTGKKIKKQLKKIDESQWLDFLNRNYNSSLQPEIIAEQGTFAVGQNDFVDKLIFKVGGYTPISSHPFTTVVGKKIKGPESFEEIPDMVASDYRNWLETRWINRLRSKSKVEINQEVLKTVNNQ